MKPNTPVVAAPSDEPQALVHHRTLLPRYPRLPRKGERCYPCVRYDLSPISQAAHVRSAVDVAHNPSVQVLPVGAAYVAWTDVGAIRLIVL